MPLSPRTTSRASRPKAWWIALFLSCSFFLFVIIYSLQTSGHAPEKVGMLAAVATLIGISVGAAEVLSRYRDEPFLALVTAPATSYLLLNGLISLAAFAMLLRYPDSLLSGIGDDLVLTALAAGFGGMVVARSKLFTYQGEGGGEYSFGPAIVLETFLKALDRKIDRLRSATRQERVSRCIRDLTMDEPSFDFALDYLQASLFSYQNFSEAEKTAIAKEIEGYRSLSDWPLPLRMLAIGFAILNLVGENNFDQVMCDLKEALPARARPPAAVGPDQPDTPGTEGQGGAVAGALKEAPRHADE